MVQEFNTIKILSLRNIEEIDDIGPVQENTEDLHLQTSNYIFNANISAVKNLETYNACVSCKGRVEPLTPPGGHCSRRDYGMFQRIDRCSTWVSAQLYIEHGNDKDKKSIYLWAFGATVGRLAGNIPPEEVNTHQLVMRPTFDSIKFDEVNSLNPDQRPNYWLKSDFRMTDFMLDIVNEADI